MFNTLIVLAIALYVFLIFAMRALRRMRYRVDRPAQVGFSIEQLHQMRAQGLLSDEEFEKAKMSVLARGGKEMPPLPMAPDRRQQRGFDVLPPKKPLP